MRAPQGGMVELPSEGTQIAPAYRAQPRTPLTEQATLCLQTQRAPPQQSRKLEGRRAANHDFLESQAPEALSSGSVPPTVLQEGPSSTCTPVSSLPPTLSSLAGFHQ